MNYEFSRTELLLGKDAIDKLAKSKVAVFGIGGVGSYVVEGLARCGVGNFLLIDNDTVCITNINRQIIAMHDTIGKVKVEAAKERIMKINPSAKVETLQTFYKSEHNNQLPLENYNYIIDAIDTVSSKIDLIIRSKEMNIPIISCMGMGNKLDPTKIEVSDLFNTSVCPLAKVMRKELRKKDINSLKVVYSKEEALTPIKISYEEEKTATVGKRQVPGSVSFVPSVAGLVIAGEVIKDLIK